jgi:hypothetical protein
MRVSNNLAASGWSPPPSVLSCHSNTGGTGAGGVDVVGAVVGAEVLGTGAGVWACAWPSSSSKGLVDLGDAFPGTAS